MIDKKRIIREDLSENQIKRVKALAYFWRYGWMVLVFVVIFILASAGFEKNLYLLSMSITFLIYGLYVLLGYALGFRHIYCMYQKAYHQEMTPNKIEWYSRKKADYYGVPAIFIIFGLIGVIATLIL